MHQSELGMQVAIQARLDISIQLVHGPLSFSCDALHRLTSSRVVSHCIASSCIVRSCRNGLQHPITHTHTHCLCSHTHIHIAFALTHTHTLQMLGVLPCNCRLCGVKIAGFSHGSIHYFLKHNGQLQLGANGKVVWGQCFKVMTTDSSSKTPEFIDVDMCVLNQRLGGMRVCKGNLCPCVVAL